MSDVFADELADSAPAVPFAAVDISKGLCPVSADFLPANMRKHVDSKAPVALRMMAAKALVPLSPKDMLGALFMLTFDDDANVKETAYKSILSLPDRLLTSGLRDEAVPPPVLAFFLETLGGQDIYAEMLVLNASTPDEAIGQFALRCSGKMAELISQNQLRVLRHENIVRQLSRNTNASAALIDVLCDFAVRSGLHLADVPQMKAARIRVFGPEIAEKVPEQGVSAEELLNEYDELVNESAAPLEESKRLTLSQRIGRMNVAEKIKLATKGNKEARNILIRDSNRLVSVAVIRSPKVTMGEVRLAAMSRSMNDDVLRIIYTNREWTKDYPLRLALVKNPKIPQAISLRWLVTLREIDVKGLARDKNVANVVSMTAKKMIEKKTSTKRGQ